METKCEIVIQLDNRNDNNNNKVSVGPEVLEEMMTKNKVKKICSDIIIR